MTTPILLILDLDETLIRAVESPLERPCDFQVFGYHVYRRPYLEPFLHSCARHFQLAVWTSGVEKYAQAILAQILPPDLSLTFVWSRARCTVAWTEQRDDLLFLKDLKKVKKKGFRLERVLAIDDRPEVYARSYGNLVPVRPFLGAVDDEELRLLAAYLPSLADCDNVRRLEKRNWRERVARADSDSRS